MNDISYKITKILEIYNLKIPEGYRMLEVYNLKSLKDIECLKHTI